MEVSRLRSGRLSGKKNYPTTSWHRPLSARNEHHSHPLAGQAQACGRLIRRMDRGPMAPVETTGAATVDQRCPFKHRTEWRHNHSNSKLCVGLRMGQATLLSITNCHLCAGATLSSRSIFQATRFVRVILEQGAMSSSQGKKTPRFVRVILVQAIPLYRSKKNYPSQILNVILAQGPCDSVQRKIRRQARREVRTSGPALEGSIVSLLVNTMGGLSGGRRGGDVSGAASAPSLVVARLLARALALDLACGIRCPPFVIRKAYASDGSSTPRRKSSAMRRLCCSTRRAKRSISLASASGASLLLVRGGLLARGRISSPLSAAAMLPPVLPEGGSDRVQAEHDARPPSLALDFPARFRSPVPDVRYQLHWGALQHAVLPVLPQNCHVFCYQLLRRGPTRKGGTELLLSFCALCCGLVLDCASGVVVEPTCLCHCFGHVFRAWDQVCLEHCGGQVSQFCRVDQRQSGPARPPKCLRTCLTARRH